MTYYVHEQKEEATEPQPRYYVRSVNTTYQVIDRIPGAVVASADDAESMHKCALHLNALYGHGQTKLE